MFYVYILNSENVPKHFYAGRTSELRRRLQEQNRCDLSHTANLRPWRPNSIRFLFCRITMFESKMRNYRFNY